MRPVHAEAVKNISIVAEKVKGVYGYEDGMINAITGYDSSKNAG
jgi:hypothetical protein